MIIKKKDIPETCCVSLIYAYKVALDKERYLLCKSIQEELIRRKYIGELTNDLIEAIWYAYDMNTREFMRYSGICWNGSKRYQRYWFPAMRNFFFLFIFPGTALVPSRTKSGTACYYYE